LDRRNVRDRTFFTMGGLALLLLAVLSGLFCGSAQGQAEADKKEVFNKVAREWILVGQKQYERGFYSQAEETLLRITSGDYQQYLSGGDRKKIDKLLEKIRVAVVERSLFIERSIHTAEDMMMLGKLAEAKAHLEKLKADKSLSKAETALVEKAFEKLEAKAEEQKKEIAGLYSRSVDLYQAGEFEKAREGFVKVVRSGFSVGPAEKAAEHYLVTIDKIISKRAEFKLSKELEVEESPETRATDIEEKLLGIKAEDFARVEASKELEDKGRAAAEPVEEKSRFVKSVDGKTKILYSYLDAVLSDTKDKVKKYIGTEEFYKARKAIDTAAQRVLENRFRISGESLKYYGGQLKQLGVKIEAAEVEKERRLAEQKRMEALEKQRRLREEMAEKVKSSLEEGRYKEALELLQVLIATEPLNNDDTGPK